MREDKKLIYNWPFIEKMKKLNDILKGVDILEMRGSSAVYVANIAFDSRTVSDNYLFVAIPGTQVDGHKFIEQAINGGASIIVCEHFPENIKKDITYIKVKNSASALGFIASNYFNNPSDNLILVVVTGTNGKTTTVTLLYNLFILLGYKTGLLSTILNKVHDKELPATHTTPDSIQVNKVLKRMVDEGCEFAFMEVSSHAIEQDRISGLTFAGAVFTNLSHDHLDYHLTFRNYLNAKKKLFDNLPADSFALSNVDDKNGRVILQNTKARKYTYGLKNMADIKGKIIEHHFSGLQMMLDGTEVHSLVTGSFNAYNLLATYATAFLLKQNKEEVLTAITKLTGAEGRFELVRFEKNITGIVDYAHSPDALQNVLQSINALRTHNEQLITVIGAGGDRDKEKRPKMANIASLLSNLVILTSDNPRSENPNKIIEEMQQGIDPAKMNKTLVIADRKEAIKTAVNLARSGDLILVAGKGHEKYQEIMGVKHPFDDKEILTELLKTT